MKEPERILTEEIRQKRTNKAKDIWTEEAQIRLASSLQEAYQ